MILQASNPSGCLKVCFCGMQTAGSGLYQEICDSKNTPTKHLEKTVMLWISGSGGYPEVCTAPEAFDSSYRIIQQTHRSELKTGGFGNCMKIWIKQHIESHLIEHI